MNIIKSRLYFPARTAWSYLFSRGEPRFASFLTIVSILGVAIGIAALIVVISVMVGFSHDLEAKLMGFNPHVTVMFSKYGSDEVADKIRSNFSKVEGITPFVTGEAIIQARGADGMSPMGVKVLGLNRIPDRMMDNAKFYWGNGLMGRLWWHKVVQPLYRGVIVGADIGYQIGVTPYFGNHVQLIAPFGGIDPMGNPVPTRREYRVVGQFESGLFDYDFKYVLMPYSEAKRLLKDQGRYGLRIMLGARDEIRDFVKNLQKFLGPTYKVSGWSEQNRRLLSALKLERLAMGTMMVLIIVIASFSITGVSLMIYFSKRRDLAILKAMGASKGKISSIFLCYGAFIGLAGALLGTVFAFVLGHFIRGYKLPPTYYLDYIPVHMSLPIVLPAIVGGVVIAVLASYYPARRASLVDPIELLRYE